MRTARAALTGLLIASFASLFAIGVLPRTGAYRTLTVLSGSMQPRMARGSLVVQRPKPAAALRVGDVLTYETPDGGIVTHRVIQIVRSGERPVIRTKGDAGAEPDPWLAELDGARVWTVRLVVPRIGYAIIALRSPLARRVTGLVAPLVLCGLWLGGIWRQRELEDVVWESCGAG